jgi:UDP-galactopyranose mutase
MTNAFDLVCFSHLRWAFVYQRPQHVLSRCARDHRVFFIEEPIFEENGGASDRLETVTTTENVITVTPYLAQKDDNKAILEAQQKLLKQFFIANQIVKYVSWYYTPLALDWFTDDKAIATVYDCMDELSAFKGASPHLKDCEKQLFKKADLVFTGGTSLYEHKKSMHPSVFAFPSSVDVPHFARARKDIGELTDPDDQKDIAHPRLGFFGVVDERMDIELLDQIALLKPDFQFVIIGPVVKIDEKDLPRRPNIHYLGSKQYAELPAYISGWDVAIMPFARNESTKYISPTKTPEYLAAGRPVVSTSIADVVKPYGLDNLVHIADQPEDFVRACQIALEEDEQDRLKRVAPVLAAMSWDTTWQAMAKLIDDAIEVKLSQKKSAESLRMPSRSHSPQTFDYLVVGAGFAGAVVAERLASQANKKVLIVDRRPHIAGNAFDHYNEDGVLVHKYGPHIFHTNSDRVFTYLSDFTDWRQYEHRVLAQVEGQLLPIPINRDTVNKLYNLDLQTEEEVEAYFASKAEKMKVCKTSEDVVVARVGRDLYEKFFRNYTIKQWGLDPSELDASVTSRVPTRSNQDDRYFGDKHQCMPLHGYTRMFEKMLSHPNIKIMLNADYREIRTMVPHRHIVYTGPVDEYFNYRYGKLPYRSLAFKHETLDQEQVLPVAVVNYPNDHAYTRVTEFKQLTGQTHHKSSLVYEFPQAEGDPYYPIPKAECTALYNKYKELADDTPGVHFVGRLATYKYYNMDQVVGQALATAEKIMNEQEGRKKLVADIAMRQTA